MMCDNCPASKKIKDTIGCNGDRLYNAWEDLKHEFFKIFKRDYQPQYQCRFADLVEMERKEREKMSKETRYVLCDTCGGKIYLNSEVYCFDGYCGVYCSAQCYADAHATIKVLDEDEADNCRCDILDDDTIEKEKANI